MEHDAYYEIQIDMKLVIRRNPTPPTDPAPIWGFAAEGPGVTGGTSPFTVTTSADGTSPIPTGSLRDALSTAGRRVTFASDMSINLVADLAVPSNTTIDGGMYRVHTHGKRWYTTGKSNILVRNIGSYPGDNIVGGDAVTLDCFGFTNCDLVLLDRVCAAFSKDECIDFTNCTRTTVQRSVLAWPLHLPPVAPHPSGRHALFARMEAAVSGLGGVSFVGNVLAFGSWRPNILKKGQLVKNVVYGINHGPDYNPGDVNTFTASHPFNVVQTVGELTEVDILDNTFIESANADSRGIPARAVRIDTSISGTDVHWRMKDDLGVNNNIFKQYLSTDIPAPIVTNGFAEHPVLNFSTPYLAMKADPYFVLFNPIQSAGPLNPDNVVLKVRGHILDPARTGVHANQISDAIPGGIGGIL